MTITRPAGHTPGDPLAELRLAADTHDEQVDLDELYRMVRESGVGGILDRLVEWPAGHPVCGANGADEIDDVPGTIAPAAPPW